MKNKLIKAVVVLSILGVSVYASLWLHSNSFCFSQARFLSEKEFCDLALQREMNKITPIPGGTCAGFERRSDYIVYQVLYPRNSIPKGASSYSVHYFDRCGKSFKF